jgi:hypothetical protein
MESILVTYLIAIKLQELKNNLINIILYLENWKITQYFVSI